MRAAFLALVVVGVGAAAGPTAARAQDCEAEFDSTFALIEKVIFENRGCTNSACHGQAAQGGLTLLAGLAYDELVDQPVESIPADQYPGLRRVVPARKDRSLLWLNVAAATLPDLWKAPKQPMPLGLPPLPRNELDLLSMWFDYGAPREGVVPGTGELVDACLPKPKPLRVEPLPPPPDGLGVQMRAPHQVLPANTERETCFVSYYDLTGKVAEEFLSPDGNFVRVKSLEGRQDPLSHHAVVINYKGTTPIDSPVWGPFACRGGARDGESCEPTDDASCGTDGVCASPPVQSVACIGFGPGDASIGNGSETLFSTMATGARGVEGVYEEVPIKGILVWNSHAFNITDEPAELDMWVNIEFAPAEEQLRKLTRVVDISEIFSPNAPAFGTDLVCQHHILPPAVSVLDLASHMHKRGRRFRVFKGLFACGDGPSAGAACLPVPADEDLPVPDICGGAACESRRTPRAGDCDFDMVVSVAEIMTGVRIALGAGDVAECTRFDADDDERVSIDELVMAVDSSINAGVRDPDASLIYTTITYADPLILSLDPPMELGGYDSSGEERALTYCAEYDNGFTDPTTVKRLSRIPTNGSPCVPTHCAEGKVGEPCQGFSAEQRDRSCDSASGALDGWCDACPVRFGITTDDEMFVLIASHVPK